MTCHTRHWLSMFVVGVALALPIQAQPLLFFFPQEIVTGGITAGAEVLLFGGGQAEQRGVLVFHNECRVQYEGYGEVQGTTFAIDDPVPEHSVWLVLDRSSGQWTIDSPDPTVDLEVPFPSTLLKSTGAAGGRGASLDVLDIPWRRARLLIVRPGSYAAGTMLLMDGSAIDGDADTNRRVEADLAWLQGAPGTAGIVPWLLPSTLAAGDIVAVFDLDKTRLAVTTITPDDLKDGSIVR